MKRPIKHEQKERKSTKVGRKAGICRKEAQVIECVGTKALGKNKLLNNAKRQN